MSKFTRFNVSFESEEKCTEAFEIFQDFQNNAQKRYKEHNPDYKGEVFTCIQDLEEQGETEFSFELVSTRDKNVDWQTQIALALLKENGGVDELSVDEWVDLEGFYFSDGSLDDYEPKLD